MTRLQVSLCTIVLDHFNRAREIVPRLAGWMPDGKLKAQETVVDGFEQLPMAINMLFDGGTPASSS